MQDRHHARYFFLLALILCLVLYTGLMATRAQAHTSQAAHAATANKSTITLNVTIGFDAPAYNMYRIGKWTPVHIMVSNHASSFFKGTLAVNTQADSQDPSNINYRSPWKFERAVALAGNTQQTITLYVPFYYDDTLTPGVTVNVLNASTKVVATQSISSQFEIRPGNILIGVLSDHASELTSFDVSDLPGDTPVTVVQLDAHTLPTMAVLLDNFDIIIIDDFASKLLQPDQLLALETWINQGGILIESGGAQWQRTLGSLSAALVPVSVMGTTMLPAGTQLLDANDPIVQASDQQIITTPISLPIAINIANPRITNAFTQNQVVITTDSLPLYIQAHEGQGAIGYVAIDMLDTNVNSWEGLYGLWRYILSYALGNQMLVSDTIESYPEGPGGLLVHAGVLNTIEPGTPPGPFILLILLTFYGLVLGPIRFYASRRLKRPYFWDWRIITASVVVFSLFSFTLAIYQRNASITDNSISIMQMNQAGDSAHATTYSGLFVPDQGNFTLTTPGENLVQPIANQFQTNNSSVVSKSDQPAIIVNGSDSTALNLPNLLSWTLHYTATEQDLRFHGRLTTHLSMNGNSVTGTISNTLDTGLSDLYLLMPNMFVPIGNIASGETLQVDAHIYSTPPHSGKNLAEQIAGYNGLPADYFPYLHNSQPQTEQQRHVALLSALEGTGINFQPCQGPCQTYGISNKNILYITGGRVPNPGMNTYEPLLLNNVPATLIGWTDQPLTRSVTVNGWQPMGQQDSFFQMPVNLNFVNAANIPPDLLQGQVIDMESYDAVLMLSGIYTMSDGNITFALTMPETTHPLKKGLTINEPDLWANPFGPGTTANTSPSHLHAQLFNWLTDTWDTVTFHQDAFTTRNTEAYIGTGGRILLQLSNDDELDGMMLYFGTPSLSFQ
jgi:hypothetical protein